MKREFLIAGPSIDYFRQGPRSWHIAIYGPRNFLAVVGFFTLVDWHIQQPAANQET